MRKAFTIAVSIYLAVAFAWESKGHAGNLPPVEAVAAASEAREGAGPDASVVEASVALALSARRAVAHPAVQDSNGPTVFLNYRSDTLEKNPIRSFMHFVPLITPVPVGREICAENRQHVGIISHEKKVTSKSFSATCEFEMAGTGFCRYTFDPAGMIALRIAESRKAKGETLTNLLDYINFQGEGFGRIHIKGTIEPEAQPHSGEGLLTVTEVELEFNDKGRKSPVTIGLYELKPKEGHYRYENRSQQIIARVNSLTFKRSENPRMGITVASISKRPGTNGPLEHLKAAIANLFIKPVKIDPLGNEAMLNFGLALLEQQPTFTFPKADNMKEIPLLAVDRVKAEQAPMSQ